MVKTICMAPRQVERDAKLIAPPDFRLPDLAGLVAGAVAAPHGACLTAAERFIPSLFEACLSVTARIEPSRDGAAPAPAALPSTPATEVI